MQEAKKPNMVVVGLIAMVLIVAVAVGVLYVINRQNQSSTESSNGTDTPDTSTSTGDSTARSYKDGSYTATGSYLSPGGQESVDVELTLKGGVIESAIVSPHPAAATSRQYQGEFVANFEPLVVGKSIDEVKLSRVAGSSLTSGGFNEAIEKIKDEAAV